MNAWEWGYARHELLEETKLLDLLEQFMAESWPSDESDDPNALMARALRPECHRRIKQILGEMLKIAESSK